MKTSQVRIDIVAKYSSASRSVHMYFVQCLTCSVEMLICNVEM